MAIDIPKWAGILRSPGGKWIDLRGGVTGMENGDKTWIGLRSSIDGLNRKVMGEEEGKLLGRPEPEGGTRN